ncbi:ammonium transporter [Ascoidea rubescens DSM 1968]|uniref:Ammonium transporter n=1 Tax=Ascoidea rubescens DSM 1968 TaxID=1344418 RepID=A0A1D2VN01_9ASCO|nr:ammonium transporter [Ascoidea rubescens DSM 1968]ODV62992.1 ammonium transporter [Ascoidea rubescens DSM 1968]
MMDSVEIAKAVHTAIVTVSQKVYLSPAIDLVKRQVWTEEYDSGITTFIILASVFVFLMVPGLGFLYSGLARRKSALSMIFICLGASAVCEFQWYLWGYTLAFSSSASNNFIGNLKNVVFHDVLGESGDYPELAFALFQGLFLQVTAAITVGCIAERGRLLPCLVFIFFWATIVYCPIAYWVWNGNGWAFNWKSGVLDFAGGGPVEIVSGFSAFAYSYVLGRRKEKYLINFRPHNVSMVTLGTSLLWTGWMGFNGGTALYPNLKAIYAIINTNLSAVFGAFTWVLLDWRMEKKFSSVAFSSGAISALVAATPSSGCIPFWASIIQGIVTSVVCNFSTGLKVLLRCDDSLDILAEHGMAGVVGLIFNALFGQDWVIGLDGATEHEGGWLSHNWKQLYIQIAYILACAVWSFGISYILAFIINKIPGLQLRTSESAEIRGTDEDQIGEFAYDYVEVRREFFDWETNEVYENNPEVRQAIENYQLNDLKQKNIDLKNSDPTKDMKVPAQPVSGSISSS